jgi:hypothetical protein
VPLVCQLIRTQPAEGFLNRSQRARKARLQRYPLPHHNSANLDRQVPFLNGIQKVRGSNPLGSTKRKAVVDGYVRSRGHGVACFSLWCVQCAPILASAG